MLNKWKNLGKFSLVLGPFYLLLVWWAYLVFKPMYVQTFGNRPLEVYDYTAIVIWSVWIVSVSLWLLIGLAQMKVDTTPRSSKPSHQISSESDRDASRARSGNRAATVPQGTEI